MAVRRLRCRRRRGEVAVPVNEFEEASVGRRTHTRSRARPHGLAGPCLPWMPGIVAVAVGVVRERSQAGPRRTLRTGDHQRRRPVAAHPAAAVTLILVRCDGLGSGINTGVQHCVMSETYRFQLLRCRGDGLQLDVWARRPVLSCRILGGAGVGPRTIRRPLVLS